MNTSHLHIAFNHLPVIGIILGTVILSIGFISNKNQLKMTSLYMFILVTVMTGIAWMTGLSSIILDENNQEIQNHQLLTRIFFYCTLVLGVLSLLTYKFSTQNKKQKNICFIILLLFSIPCTILSIYMSIEASKI